MGRSHVSYETKSADVAVTFPDRPNTVAIVPGSCIYSMLHPCALRSESKAQAVQDCRDLEACSSFLGRLTRDLVLRTTAGCWLLEEWRIWRDRYLAVKWKSTPVVVQAP